MRYLILILVTTSTFFLSCKKKDKVPSGATLDKQSSFESGAHSTSGSAKFYKKDGSNTLFLDDFKTDSGPALYVYLSTSMGTSDYKDLGSLKGVKGNYSYCVPGDVDLTKYKYVLIYCKQYSVLFGYATF